MDAVSRYFCLFCGVWKCILTLAGRLRYRGESSGGTWANVLLPLGFRGMALVQPVCVQGEHQGHSRGVSIDREAEQIYLMSCPLIPSHFLPEKTEDRVGKQCANHLYLNSKELYLLSLRNTHLC